jgi:hypothetical protein
MNTLCIAKAKHRTHFLEVQTSGKVLSLCLHNNCTHIREVIDAFECFANLVKEG